METLFEFLIKASAGIILLYSVYWLFLRKETFYTANRWFLLIALISAVLIPLFPIQYTLVTEQQNNTNTIQTIADTFQNIPVISEQESIAAEISWQQIVMIVYLTGVAIFLLRLLIQTGVLFRLIIKYRIKSMNGTRIVENEKYGLPFSFFNVVFINPKFHKQENLPEILAHENVHIRENHWFDLLLIELLTVIFWFNPFIWFFEQSIKQNHEYLADKGVLSEGHSVGRYQALLVNQLMGMQIIGITNNLNFALNTNRLKMMTKKKTSTLGWIKFVWTLPVLALLLFAFAKPSYRVRDIDPNNQNVSIRELTTEKTIKINGLVLNEKDKLPMPGASIVIKGSTKGTVSDKEGEFKLEVPEDSKIAISFVGKKTKVIEANSLTRGVNNPKVTILLADVVVPIYNRFYSSEQMVPPPPPPPPPPPKSEKFDSEQTPPPPPPPTKGEKEVFYIVEDMPKYPGGYEALMEYVSKMQKKIAIQKKVQGKATINFTIATSGKVTEIKVVEQENENAAKGAYILAKEMSDWKPGKQRGKAVPVKYLLPVEFK